MTRRSRSNQLTLEASEDAVEPEASEAEAVAPVEPEVASEEGADVEGWLMLRRSGTTKTCGDRWKLLGISGISGIRMYKEPIYWVYLGYVFRIFRAIGSSPPSGKGSSISYHREPGEVPGTK